MVTIHICTQFSKLTRQSYGRFGCNRRCVIGGWLLIFSYARKREHVFTLHFSIKGFSVSVSSLCLSLSLCLCLSLSLSAVCLSVSLSASLCVCVSLWLPLCLCLSLSLSLSVPPPPRLCLSPPPYLFSEQTSRRYADGAERKLKAGQ